MSETQVKKVKFKVRDLGTGLYQDGKVEKFTGEPTWSKRGKIWKDIGELKKHFSALEAFRISLSPLWEVIEYQTKETDAERYPATVLTTKKKV